MHELITKNIKRNEKQKCIHDISRFSYRVMY